MNLEKVILYNFRGYKDTTEILIDGDLTALVGKNDAGKSSVLDALEIFFNSESVRPEADDRSVFGTDEFFSITCVFGNVDVPIVIDSDAETTLRDEYLLNKDGFLQVEKRYRGNSKITVSTFIIAEAPSDVNAVGLHSIKISDLKKKCKERGISCSGDERVSANWRKAVWEHTVDLRLSTQAIEITKAAEDMKSIADRVTELMPVFALFKSDRASSDGDPEAKNPDTAGRKVGTKNL